MRRRTLAVIMGCVMISLVGCQSESKLETISTDSTAISTEASTAKNDKETTTSTEATEASSTAIDTTETDTKEQPTTIKEVPEDETLVSRDKSTYTEDITYDMMARFPDDYEEKPLKTTGKIVQVVEENYTLDNGLTYSAYRFSMGGDVDKTIMVMLQKDNSMVGRILENDEITFYGVAYGTYTYENVMGNNVTVPLMLAVMYDLEDGTGTTIGGNETGNKPSNTKANISETVVYDANGIKVTAKSIAYDGWMGPELKLNVENNSGRNITVQARNASINGYMVDPTMSIDVANGKKANDGMSFSKTELETCGIKTIADIEFSLHIIDGDKWDKIADSPIISLKTDAADGFEYTYDENGDVLYDAGGIKIVAQGIEDNWMGKGLKVCIINNSGQNICVQARDSSINGYMVDASISSDVINGKHCVDSIDFYKRELEENDITSIDDIQLYFHIFTMDGWDVIVDTPVITWKAK